MHSEVLSYAEAQLIWTIRASRNFTVTVRADDGRWDVRLEDHDIGMSGSGTGWDFPSAWNDIAAAPAGDNLVRARPGRAKAEQVIASGPPPLRTGKSC